MLVQPERRLRVLFVGFSGYKLQSYQALLPMSAMQIQSLSEAYLEVTALSSCYALSRMPLSTLSELVTFVPLWFE